MVTPSVVTPEASVGCIWFVVCAPISQSACSTLLSLLCAIILPILLYNDYRVHISDHYYIKYLTELDISLDDYKVQKHMGRKEKSGGSDVLAQVPALVGTNQDDGLILTTALVTDPSLYLLYRSHSPYHHQMSPMCPGPCGQS